MSEPLPDYFIHVPKTGGSSIRTLITMNYQDSERLDLYGSQPDIFERCQNAKKMQRELKLIQGHMPYGVHNYFNHTNPNYYFFLREPVARTISDINHCCRNPQHGFYDILGAPELNLMQRVQLAKDIIYYRNNMTHYISEVFFASEVGLTDLHRAIDRVWNCKFVGITEQSEKSLLMMAKHLKWQFFIPQKVNVSTQTSSITIDDVRPLCESFLLFDIELYQIALERFELNASKYGSLLDEAAEELSLIIDRQIAEFPYVQEQMYLVGEPLTVSVDYELNVHSPLRKWFETD